MISLTRVWVNIVRRGLEISIINTRKSICIKLTLQAKMRAQCGKRLLWHNARSITEAHCVHFLKKTILGILWAFIKRAKEKQIYGLWPKALEGNQHGVLGYSFRYFEQTGLTVCFCWNNGLLAESVVQLALYNLWTDQENPGWNSKIHWRKFSEA